MSQYTRIFTPTWRSVIDLCLETSDKLVTSQDEDMVLNSLRRATGDNLHLVTDTRHEIPNIMANKLPFKQY